MTSAGVPEPASINNMAAAYLSRAQWSAALELLEPLTRRHPRYEPAWANLAVAWHGLGDVRRALHVLEVGLTECPDSAGMRLSQAELLLGVDAHGARQILESIRQPPPGLAPLDAAILEDRRACLLARACALLDDEECASHVLVAAVDAAARSGELRWRHQAALHKTAARRQQAAFPTLGELRQPPWWPAWELALLRLQHGQWGVGFEAYESRLLWWSPRGWPEELRRRIWLSQPLRGRRILVAGEQGYGDQIMFWRFVPLLKSLGAHVWLGVNAPLKLLARQLLGSVLEGVLAMGDPLPELDFHVPLCSLPHRLGVRHDAELAWRISPALGASPSPAERQGRLARVGLCWQGKGSHADDLYRSIPWPEAASLIQRTAGGVHWVRVQPQWAGHPTPGLALEDESVHDFAGLAQLLSSLDLLVSVDSAPVHLAATLGIPVCMLDRAARPDWRWGKSQSDARRWYPGLEVFKQASAGCWDAPLARAAQAVMALAPAGAGS